MTISKDDEREAREWLKRKCENNDIFPSARKHARTILALLDAADAAATARDAALEEAAAIADSESKMATGHKGDPYYAGKWTAAEIIGDRIRALKGAA